MSAWGDPQVLSGGPPARPGSHGRPSPRAARAARTQALARARGNRAPGCVKSVWGGSLSPRSRPKWTLIGEVGCRARAAGNRGRRAGRAELGSLCTARSPGPRPSCGARRGGGASRGVQARAAAVGLRGARGSAFGARRSGPGARETPSPSHCSASPGQGGPSGRRRPGGSLRCADARGALSATPGTPAGNVRAADAGLWAARSPQLVSSIVAERVSHLVSGSPPLSCSLAGRGLVRYSASGDHEAEPPRKLAGAIEPRVGSRSWAVAGSPASALPSFGGDEWGSGVSAGAPRPRALPLSLSRRAPGSPRLSLSPPPRRTC